MAEQDEIVVKGIELRRLAEDVYEGENALRGIDYHIRREGEKWLVDVFDSSVKGGDDAHINSAEFDTLAEAVSAAHQSGKALRGYE